MKRHDNIVSSRDLYLYILNFFLLYLTNPYLVRLAPRRVALLLRRKLSFNLIRSTSLVDCAARTQVKTHSPERSCVVLVSMHPFLFFVWEPLDDYWNVTAPLLNYLAKEQNDSSRTLWHSSGSPRVIVVEKGYMAAHGSTGRSGAARFCSKLPFYCKLWRLLIAWWNSCYAYDDIAARLIRTHCFSWPCLQRPLFSPSRLVQRVMTDHDGYLKMSK